MGYLWAIKHLGILLQGPDGSMSHYVLVGLPNNLYKPTCITNMAWVRSRKW